MRKLLLIAILFSFTASAQTPMHRLIGKKTSSCTYLLDTYTGSAGGYSVAFKLRTAYSGSAFRVRRSNDNAEQDIGFTGCSVDTSSLKTFVGANSGYVVTIYDQVGSSDVTQSTTSSQARIVNAGTIDRVSGQPSMYFNGSNGYDFSAFAGQTRMDFYFIQSTSDGSYVQFYSGGAQFGYVADGFCLGSSSNFGTPDLYTNGSLQTSTTRCDVQTALNGTYIVTIQNSSTSGWSSCNYGNYGSFEFTGYVSQIVGWASDQSSNRGGIVSAFNSQFSIY